MQYSHHVDNLIINLYAIASSYFNALVLYPILTFSIVMLWLFIDLVVKLELPHEEASHEVEGDHEKVLFRNAMEHVTWVHKESSWFARSMHASILMWVSGCFI